MLCTAATPAVLAARVVGKGVVLRDAIGLEATNVGVAQRGEQLCVRRLERTRSGTLRAETDQGWATATTSYGKELLALPDGASAAALAAAEPPPRPAETDPVARRAELRRRLETTPFLEHGDPLFVHGRAYDGAATAATAPRTTWRCRKPPRDDHDTAAWLTASEYSDTPDTTRLKVQQLATMLRLSRKTVIYSGAGISASVIGQAARSGTNKQGWEGNRHAAEPTFTHKALGMLVQEGLVHSWIQQNHDGLPQKAGVPQEMINEIHVSAPQSPPHLEYQRHV